MIMAQKRSTCVLNGFLFARGWQLSFSHRDELSMSQAWDKQWSELLGQTAASETSKNAREPRLSVQFINSFKETTHWLILCIFLILNFIQSINGWDNVNIKISEQPRKRSAEFTDDTQKGGKSLPCTLQTGGCYPELFTKNHRK